MENKRLPEIELDCDGVLANLEGGYSKYVKDIIPDYTKEKYLTDWNMPKMQMEYPEAFYRIQNLWCNADYIRHLKSYPNVAKGMNKLYNGVKDKANIVVHTHLFVGGSVYESRKAWLESLKDKSNAEYKIDICVGSEKKTRQNTKVLVEDNVSNLNRSSADYKILIRREHNRNYGVRDLGKCKRAFVCNSFYESVDIILKVFGV